MFRDDDDTHYLYFGGLWGGQLQRWRTGIYDPTVPRDPMDDGPALGPRIARLAEDMKHFAEPVREIRILDEDGDGLIARTGLVARTGLIGRTALFSVLPGRGARRAKRPR